MNKAADDAVLNARWKARNNEHREALRDFASKQEQRQALLGEYDRAVSDYDFDGLYDDHSNDNAQDDGHSQ